MYTTSMYVIIDVIIIKKRKNSKYKEYRKK